MSTTKKILLWVQAAFYTFAGINHFLKPEFYMKIMPPFVPMHAEMVALSGIAEIVVGVGLLVPPYRRLAAWGVIALLIAVFPANIYAATLAGTAADPFPNVPVAVAWARLPFQGLFIAWAWWYTTDVPAKKVN